MVGKKSMVESNFFFGSASLVKGTLRSHVFVGGGFAIATSSLVAPEGSLDNGLGGAIRKVEAAHQDGANEGR